MVELLFAEVEWRHSMCEKWSTYVMELYSVTVTEIISFFLYVFIICNLKCITNYYCCFCKLGNKYLKGDKCYNVYNNNS